MYMVIIKTKQNSQEPNSINKLIKTTSLFLMIKKYNQITSFLLVEKTTQTKTKRKPKITILQTKPTILS